MSWQAGCIGTVQHLARSVQVEGADASDEQAVGNLKPAQAEGVDDEQAVGKLGVLLQRSTVLSSKGNGNFK
jgi:hypothetical protein